MVAGQEHAPGETAPVSGTCELLNPFGMPSGSRVVVPSRPTLSHRPATSNSARSPISSPRWRSPAPAASGAAGSIPTGWWRSTVATCRSRTAAAAVRGLPSAGCWRVARCARRVFPGAGRAAAVRQAKKGRPAPGAAPRNHRESIHGLLRTRCNPLVRDGSMSEAKSQQFNGVKLRVSDRVLGVVEYACLVRDMETARDLIGVLEKMASRRARRFGGDRRASITAQVEAAHELVRRARELPSA